MSLLVSLAEIIVSEDVGHPCDSWVFLDLLGLRSSIPRTGVSFSAFDVGYGPPHSSSTPPLFGVVPKNVRDHRPPVELPDLRVPYGRIGDRSQSGVRPHSGRLPARVKYVCYRTPGSSVGRHVFFQLHFLWFSPTKLQLTLPRVSWNTTPNVPTGAGPTGVPQHTLLVESFLFRKPVGRASFN